MKELLRQVDNLERDVEKLKSLQDSGGGGGTVTAVTASSPLASSGGTTPDISLNNSTVTPGSYTNTNLTVDAHGLITAASSGSAGGVTSVTGTAPIASSGGATPDISLNNSGVSAGTYTNATVQVNAKGLVTSASSGTAPVTSVGATAPVTSTGGATPNIGISITTTNDGGAIVKQGSTPGTAQSSANAHIDGTLIADTQLQSALVIPTTAVKGSSSNFPTVGSTTLAEKMGSAYLADGKDLFPDNDQYGLWDRFVNWGFTPDEHWGQGADELTWTGYATYTSFVTPASISTSNSNYYAAHNAAASAFRYRAAATGANIFLRCRVNITYVVSAGIMIDDGVNNADGNGANNFYRVYLTQSALAGAITAVEQYRTGGGAVTTNVGPTMPYGPYAGLRIQASGTRWTSWQGFPSTFGEGGQAVQFTGGSSAFSWTPARVGLYAKFTAVDAARKGMWDWYDEATS